MSLFQSSDWNLEQIKTASPAYQQDVCDQVRVERQLLRFADRIDAIIREESDGVHTLDSMRLGSYHWEHDLNTGRKLASATLIGTKTEELSPDGFAVEVTCQGVGNVWRGWLVMGHAELHQLLPDCQPMWLMKYDDSLVMTLH